MKFRILLNQVIYGGGPGFPEYKVIRDNVSADYVKGFFESLDVDKNLKTKPDSMGCYDCYQVEVSDLELCK